MTSTISINVAKEHLLDAQDNLVEAIKTIRRVGKNFPDLESELSQATTHLNLAKELMQVSGRRLPR
jgi:hypothetical protein